MPLSFYKTAAHHSTKRAGEFPTAENVIERTDDGVQKEQFACIRNESHDLLVLVLVLILVATPISGFRKKK